MAKQRKMVKIDLDKERNLYFTLNSLEIVEDLTGKTIDKISEGMNIKMLKVLVYAGLIHEDKELTVDAVGEMIGIEDMERVSKAIGEAFEGLK